MDFVSIGVDHNNLNEVTKEYMNFLEADSSLASGLNYGFNWPMNVNGGSVLLVIHCWFIVFSYFTLVNVLLLDAEKNQLLRYVLLSFTSAKVLFKEYWHDEASVNAENIRLPNFCLLEN